MSTSSSPSIRTVLAGSAALTAALSLATPEIMRWEGKRNLPYRDIGGVLTVCHGETQVAMRRYSDAECAAMLTRHLRDRYAPPVLRCVPALAVRPAVFAATLSLSYNIGPSAFCRSDAARRFRAGQWRAGCDAMRAWVRAGGRRIPGLVRRREAERRLCLTGVGPA